jgi:hypothetical protein
MRLRSTGRRSLPMAASAFAMSRPWQRGDGLAVTGGEDCSVVRDFVAEGAACDQTPLGSSDGTVLVVVWAGEAQRQGHEGKGVVHDDESCEPVVREIDTALCQLRLDRRHAFKNLVTRFRVIDRDPA